MTEEIIRRYIKQGEGRNVEFKRAEFDVPSDLYETVCSFLNRSGGIIILGIDKKGKIVGVNESAADSIINKIVTTSNNRNKLDPPFILFPSKMKFKEGLIIYIQVPESSQVHKCDGIIFDRSDDGDFRLTDQHLITTLYNRKSTHYTEGQIYPEVKFDDLNIGLFPKVKELIFSRSPSHPWLAISREEMLSISGLKKRDYITGQEGYTLAAVLLLGNDYLIQSILPHYKIEAMVRIENVDRYDDRIQITTNLVNAYDLLMDFIAKSLPDKFFMEGSVRISLREKIFREVVANLIIHREYTNAYPASLTIYKDRVELLNANKPYHHGKINPTNFSPYPKNPLISKFFLQLGRAEEIGSGILNVNKYLSSYSPGKTAEFIEDDIFKTIIPITVKEKVEIRLEDLITIGDLMAVIEKSGGVNGSVNGGVSGGVSASIAATIDDAASDAISDAVKERLNEELIYVILNKGIVLADIIEKFGLAKRTAERDIKLLKDLGFIRFEGAPKTGRYVATEKTKKIIIKKTKVDNAE